MSVQNVSILFSSQLRSMAENDSRLSVLPLCYSTTPRRHKTGRVNTPERKQKRPLPVGSTTHRILPLILTAAASLALDALPPQSLDSHRELRGELETGRVACRQSNCVNVSRTQSFLQNSRWRYFSWLLFCVTDIT